MCDQSNKMPDDLLDKAISSLRDSAPPTGPTPQAISQTLTRLKATQEAHDAPQRKWRSFIMKPNFKLAVAAVLVLALLGGIWVPFSGTGNVVFAEVIAKVVSTKAVSFKISGKMPVPNQPPQNLSSEVYIVEPSRMRQVIRVPQEMIQIWDFQSAKILMLDPIRKTATVMTMTGQSNQGKDVNIIEKFKKFDAKTFDQVGEKTINNRAVVGFKSKSAQADQPESRTVWVDKQTQLPLEMEVTMFFDDGIIPETTMLFSDFQWDTTIDESLLSLTPPPGYQINTMSMDMSPATEKDLIESLRAVAQLNENAFPDRMDVTGISQVFAKMASKLPKDRNAPEWKAMNENMMQQMPKISRGWIFIADSKNRSNCHYAGKGVKLGQAGVPILWYQPKNSATYRVIDADLTVREVAPSDLPKVESMLLTGPMATTKPLAP